MLRNSDFHDYITEQHRALQDVNFEVLSRMVALIDGIRHSGNTLWLLGNGGSAATASHLVADFVKGASEEGNGAVKAVAISEQISLITAIANDHSYSDIFSRSLELMAHKSDGVLILSVSGRSPNLINAASIAKEKGLVVLSIVGADGTPLQEISNECILLDSRDYQVVENIHLTLGHWFMKELRSHVECSGK
jgi:D-sedoheptulose 7-phosphate isomerase